MQWLGTARMWILISLIGLLAGCGQNNPGKMEWVQPLTSGKPHAGTVYLFRGWKGVYSSGIDKIAGQINAAGVTAHVFMPEQYPEVAAEMVRKYKGVEHEPIVMIGHSRGADAALIIARELDKVGVQVEMIITLDSVDEVKVARNVKACYNYYLPAWFLGTNLFRGIPLEKEAGSTGTLMNLDLNTEAGRPLRDFGINHIDIEKGPLMQARVLSHVKDACPDRAVWQAKANGKRQGT